MKSVIVLIVLAVHLGPTAASTIMRPFPSYSQEPEFEIELGEHVPDRDLSQGFNTDDSVNSNQELNNISETENVNSDMDNKVPFHLDTSGGLDFGEVEDSAPIQQSHILEHGVNEGYHGFTHPLSGGGWPFHMGMGAPQIGGTGLPHGDQVNHEAQETEKSEKYGMSRLVNKSGVLAP